MRSKRSCRVLICLMGLLMLLSIVPSGSYAAVPQKINYQGSLTDSGGTLISATVSIVFSIYNVSTGGTALWSETQNVTVSNGVFSVNLGDVTPIILPFDTQYYLGVKIKTDAEMTPRRSLTTAGYAFRADKLEAISAGQIFVGDGTNGPAAVTMSGDATMASGGALTIATGAVGATELASTAVTAGAYTSTNITVDADGRITAAASGAGGSVVTSTEIQDGTIVDVDINSSAAIAHSKLASLSSGRILVGNFVNVPTSVAVSGDIAITNAGVTSIASGVVVNADISGTAAIATSKLSGAVTSILSHGLGTIVSQNSNNVTITGGSISGITDLAVADGGTGSSDGSITGTGALTFTAAGVNANVTLAPTGIGVVDVSSKKITNLDTPTADTDAATKLYVDSVSGAPTQSYTAGETLFQNDLLCFDSNVGNSKVFKCDTDDATISTYFAGVATAGANAAASIAVQTSGSYTANGTPYVANTPYYVGATAGTASITKSAIFVGWASSTSVLNIHPVAVASTVVTTTEIKDATIANADISASAAIDATKIGAGGVTSTEFGYLGTVTSDVQTQLDAKGAGDVTQTGTQTLTNKTLTTPTINGAAFTGTLSGTPTFSGVVVLTQPDINGGTLDGATVGANSASSGAFTTLSASTSLALPNSGTPTTNATGELALDTTITDHQPLLQYYDGAKNMTVIAIDTAQLPALDNEIVKYDAATDKFVLEADASGGGSTTIAARAYASVVKTLSTSWQQIPLATENYDTGADFATNIFTVPSTGFYHISGCINSTGAKIASGGTLSVGIRLGGSTIIAQSATREGFASPLSACVSTGASLSANNTIDLVGKDSSGDTLNLTTGTSLTFLSIFLIGS